MAAGIRHAGIDAAGDGQHPSLDRQAGHNNGVVDCVIYNVGGGGINMGGGNRLTLEPGGNYVQNCSISHYNRIEKSSRPAIYICGVGNRISNCEIFDAPSTAIQFNGNDHLIEYCNIHNVCSEIDDLAQSTTDGTKQNWATNSCTIMYTT